MRGISARDVGNGSFRRHFEQGADDFGQAVSDQAADALRFGRRKTAFGEAAAHGVDDGLGRIGKRAVPVEDDEFGRGHGRLVAVKSRFYAENADVSHFRQNLSAERYVFPNKPRCALLK